MIENYSITDAKLAEDVELVRAGYPGLRHGLLSRRPSDAGVLRQRLNNFGVRELLDAIAAWAPPPRPQPAEPRADRADRAQGHGLRLQGPGQHGPQPPRPHRLPAAVLRHFPPRHEADADGHRQVLSVNSPILFFAHEREIADEAWPGDIIGIPNHGVLRVGDTLTEGETIKFVGIPNFAPEILRRVRLEDPMKSKQLKRALEDLAEEGVTQVFRRVIGGDHIVGVVGELQLDVLKTRVEAEYKVKIDLEPAPFETARWISADSKADLEAFMSANRGGMSEDRDGSPVFLARNAWELGYIAEKSPKMKFSDIRERS